MPMLPGSIPDYGLSVSAVKAGPTTVRVNVLVSLDGFAYGDGTVTREVTEDSDDYGGDYPAATRAALARCLSAIGERLSRP